MPPLLAAAAVSALALTGTTALVVGAAISTVASLAMSFVMNALLKPQQQQPTSGGEASQPQTDNKVTVRQAAAARPVVYGTARLGGIYAHMQSTDNNRYLRLVILFAGHEIESFDQIWFNDEVVTLDGGGVVTSGKYAGKAVVFQHLGAPDQVADANLIGASGGAWTATDRLQGIAYLYVTLIWDAAVYGSGLPNITAVLKGKKVWDPVEEVTAWSANAALCTADFLTDETYGPGYDYDTAIDEAALIVSRNVCAESVSLAAGGTEARYECNGTFLSSDKPRDTLGRLLGAMLGKGFYDGDQWHLIAAAWQTPDFTLTQDHLRGAVEIQVLEGIQDNVNAVKGTYIGPLNGWQVADFPPLVSDLYKAQDGGEEAFDDIEFKFVSSPSQCQRIAKIHLLRKRQPISFKAACNLSVWEMLTGGTFYATLPRYGWTAKPFEATSIEFGEDTDANGNPVPGVDLTARETAEAIYDWATSEESPVDVAPNTDFPDALTCLPPSNLRVSESLYETRNRLARALVTLAWDASPDAFVTSGGGYLVEYRLTGADFWVPLPQTAALTLDVVDVAPGTYDFRVSAVNWAGRASVPLQALMVPIAGLAAPPDAPQNLTLIRNGNFAVIRWDDPANLDVALGGKIVFKHASQTSGAVWADGTTITKPLNASLTEVQLPLVAGTYMAKFRDASGVWSEEFASFATGQDGALEFDGLVGGSLVEDPDFTGTKTNCVAFDGKLKLGGAGLFSDIPLLSDVPSLSYYGGVQTSGSYRWSQKIDLGAVVRNRLTVNKTTLLVNVFDLLSERSGDVSTWPVFGGDVGGMEADAYTMVRTTVDDPNDGGAVWSDWARHDVGENFNRGYDLETFLVSSDPSFDIEITALGAIAEELV